MVIDNETRHRFQVSFHKVPPEFLPRRRGAKVPKYYFGGLGLIVRLGTGQQVGRQWHGNPSEILTLSWQHPGVPQKGHWFCEGPQWCWTARGSCLQVPIRAQVISKWFRRLRCELETNQCWIDKSPDNFTKSIVYPICRNNGPKLPSSL